MQAFQPHKRPPCYRILTASHIKTAQRMPHKLDKRSRTARKHIADYYRMVRAEHGHSSARRAHRDDTQWQ